MTSRDEITAKCQALLGIEAIETAFSVSQHLVNGDLDKGLELLCDFDQKISGYGVHTVIERDVNGAEPYDIAERSLYRPIQYVLMNLRSQDPEWITRYVIEMSCAHIEQILKLVSVSGLLKNVRANRQPMGSLINKLHKKNRISETLTSDLFWLNNKIYVLAKHDLGVSDTRNDHLFQLDEAITIYFIARKLAIQLIQFFPRITKEAGLYLG